MNKPDVREQSAGESRKLLESSDLKEISRHVVKERCAPKRGVSSDEKKARESPSAQERLLKSKRRVSTQGLGLTWRRSASTQREEKRASASGSGARRAPALAHRRLGADPIRGRGRRRGDGAPGRGGTRALGTLVRKNTLPKARSAEFELF